MTLPVIPVGEELPPLDGNKVVKSKKVKAQRQTGTRFATLNTFADFSMAGLDRAEIAVWLLLWRDTKPNGLARTSQSDLARRSGATDRTVRRAIRQLQKAGLLVVVYRGGLRKGVSTYRVFPIVSDGMPARAARC